VLWVLTVALCGGYAVSSSDAGIGAHARPVLRAAAAFGLAAWAATALAPGLLGADPAATARAVLFVVALTAAVSLAMRRVVAGLEHTAPVRVVLVGSQDDIDDVLRELDRADRAPFVPVAVCLPAGPSPSVDQWMVEHPGLAVRLDSGRVADAAAVHGCDAVLVLPGAGLDHAELRSLGVRLQDLDIALMLSTGLRDVSAQRIHLAAAGGVRLLHVRPASLQGPARAAKAIADRLGATILLALCTPLLVVLAGLVRLDSRGPALFRQTRVGRDGRPFTMIKFRTMHMDADRLLAELAEANEADRTGVLFKMRSDPRVTRIGAVLRRYSLDELPQLVNVLLGSMSLVGPRPALPAEVQAYPAELRRRLAVKPGLTGLWQVSGRSDLSWDETVRLDLQYVDNWSWRLDTAIIARTARAVLGHRGAY
jgi:exopolysaccharide biosynthesis polyprenyl glycosylphosphotransferase